MSDRALGCGGAIAGGMVISLIVAAIMNGLHSLAPSTIPDADGYKKPDPAKVAASQRAKAERTHRICKLVFTKGDFKVVFHQSPSSVKAEESSCTYGLRSAQTYDGMESTDVTVSLTCGSAARQDWSATWYDGEKLNGSVPGARFLDDGRASVLSGGIQITASFLNGSLLPGYVRLKLAVVLKQAHERVTAQPQSTLCKDL